MENDNKIIIDLLREQNQTLHKLLDFHLKKEQNDFRNAVIHFFIQAIPYIALIIIAYYLYLGIKGYLDAINSQITALHDAYLGLQTSMQDMLNKVTSIPTGIGDSLNNLNPFR